VSARHKAYLYLLIVAAVWGFAPPISKTAFSSFPPLIFLTYRFLITNFLLIPLLLIFEPDTWHKLSLLKSNDWLKLILSGILGSTFQLGLLFWGLDLTTSLDASILGAIPPILVAIGGAIFLREKITRLQTWGLAIAFTGTLVIVLQPVLSGQGLFSGSFAGNFLVFLGGVCWAIYVLITKQELKHRLSPLLLTTNMFFTGFISISLITIFFYKPLAISSMLSTAPLHSHLSVIYMAFISGALAYFLYQKAQSFLSASEADIFLYLSPIFTAPLAYFWLGEPITVPLIIGSLIIALGVIISEIKTSR
jgi:drug/metabolite transporter (DMT)-like permease